MIQHIQDVPTSLGYAKCNVLKPRKVCERSELRLQKRPNKKGEISDFNNVTGSKFKIRPFLVGIKLKNHPFLSGQNPKFTPICWVKSQNSSLFIGSIFSKRSSLQSQTFLSFRTLHLAYPKLVGTPCIVIQIVEELKKNKKKNLAVKIIKKIMFRFSTTN